MCIYFNNGDNLSNQKVNLAPEVYDSTVKIFIFEKKKSTKLMFDYFKQMCFYINCDFYQVVSILYIF